MSLDERFAGFKRAIPPDLWGDIESRTPRDAVPTGPSPGRRVVITLTALTLAAAAIGWMLIAFDQPLRVTRPVTRPQFSRFGISMPASSGWHSRASYPEGSTGPLLQIANFPLPGRDKNLYFNALARGGISIQLQEIVGCVCSGFEVTKGGPIVLTAKDFLGAGTGTAAKTVEVNGRYFDILATFGAEPRVSPTLVDRANAILRLVKVAPRVVPIPGPATAEQPMRFRTVPEWFQTTMPATRYQGVNAPVTWVSNVPIQSADLRFIARDQTLDAWPDATLRSLPSGGIVFAVSVDAGIAGLGANPSYPPMTLPLDLSNATRESSWEGQAAPNVPMYSIRANIGGAEVTIRIFFGTQHPSTAVLQEAQQMLGSLLPPSTR